LLGVNLTGLRDTQMSDVTVNLVNLIRLG
jgi:hypothetical protein